MESYIAASEIASLKHEVGDNAVELGARVAKAFLAGAKSAKVLGRLRNNVVVELEVDATALL